MAQHIWVRVNGQARAFAIATGHQPRRLTAERTAALADKEDAGRRLHPRAFYQPCFDSPDLVCAEWVHSGQALFEPGDMQDAAVPVHLRQHQAARFGHAQPVAQHQQSEAPITGFVVGRP